VQATEVAVMDEWHVCREVEDGTKAYVRRLVSDVALWHEDEALAKPFSEDEAVRLVELFQRRIQEGPRICRRLERKGRYYRKPAHTVEELTRC
jgi:hypothetical protein